MRELTKRILLDTTYLLPAMSFSVKGIPDDIILRLIAKNYLISVSSISLFEMEAVGSKYVSKDDLSATDVINGIKAIKLSPHLTIIDHSDGKGSRKSYRIKQEFARFHRLYNCSHSYDVL